MISNVLNYDDDKIEINATNVILNAYFIADGLANDGPA